MPRKKKKSPDTGYTDIDPAWVNDPCTDPAEPVPGHDFGFEQETFDADEAECADWDEQYNPKDRQGQRKVNLGLVPPAGSIYAALALEVGAMKYGPYNWRNEKVRMMSYLTAMKRHIDAIIDGEGMNPDAPWVPHLGSIIAGGAILADAVEGGFIIDDRPSRGPGPRMLQRIVRSHEDLESMEEFVCKDLDEC